MIPNQSDRYFSFPQPPRFWSGYQNRHRNTYIQKLRDGFFQSEELHAIDPNLQAGWRVGIVSRHPPPHIFFSQFFESGPAGVGFLLHTGDLWLRDPTFICQLTDLVDAGPTSKTIEERIATVVVEFLESLLTDEFIQDQVGQNSAPGERAIWSVAAVREEILQDAFALTRQMRLGKFDTHCPLSLDKLTANHEEAAKASGRDAGLPARKARLSNPHDDLHIRLLHPPFAAEGQGIVRTYFAPNAYTASIDDESARARVWLGVEFLLMKLLQGIPQVGGHGEAVLRESQSWSGPLQKSSSPKSLEESVLRTVEGILFPASSAPHAAFVPLLPEHAAREAMRVAVGYVYCIWDQSVLGKDVDQEIKALLQESASELREGFRRWLVTGYAVAATLAMNMTEFQRSVDTLCRCLVGDDVVADTGRSGQARTANLIDPKLEIDEAGRWIDLTESSHLMARFRFQNNQTLNARRVDELSFVFEIASAVRGARSDAQEEERAQTQALVYKIGHPFKHRGISVTNAAMDVSTRFAELFELFHERPDTTLLELNNVIDLNDLYNRASLTGKYAIATRTYGELVNLLSAVIEHGGIKGLYVKSDEWLQDKQVNLAHCVEYAFEYARHKMIGRIETTPVYMVDTSRLRIMPWLPSPKKDGLPLAPAELLYCEILLELVSNAANHGHDEDGLVPVEVLAETDETGVAIVLRNRVADNPARSVEVIPDFQKQTELGPSGAALVAHLLLQMDLGELAKRCPAADGGSARFWEYRLKLKGLNLLDH